MTDQILERIRNNRKLRILTGAGFAWLVIEVVAALGALAWFAR